jgi:adenylate cyclase
MAFRKPLSEHSIEVDVEALRAMGQRFAMHHRQRYLDALAKLDGRKRDILAALPMFFHANHPALPGYVQNAPCGIVGHTPTASDVSAIHRFARSFNASLATDRREIDAIFLMGSGGSLGHTADSDIDLWVCCAKNKHDRLRSKLDGLQIWAAEQGLALQGFLVDPEFFHDSRDTVHGPLLLDEFYRSGIHLAGKHPLWWYVDGSSEANYALCAAHLNDHRFVASAALLDFGAVGKPGVDALCRAGMLELGRALTTPHKSLLKLALVEAYLNQPERPLLSSHYQHLMLTGVSDHSRLDTYFMLYEYLASTKTGRPSAFTLDDLRWLFVRKIVARGRELSPTSQVALDLREWGYSTADLQALRQPVKQTLVTVLEEVNAATTVQYKGLQFGRRLAMLTPDLRADIDSIESTLDQYAKPSDPAIRPLNPALLPPIRPSLEVQMGRRNWRLQEQSTTLRTSESWAELIVWLHCNQIDTSNLKMPTHWFEQAKVHLQQALSMNRRDTLLINPLPDPNDDGERLISAFDDPLSYGGLRICKARSLYRVKRLHNPGGGIEFTLTTHSGMAAVLDALVQIINNEAGTTHVAAASREDSLLAQRIENLLVQASTAFATNAAFEFSFGDQRVHLQRDTKGIVRVGAQTPI